MCFHKWSAWSELIPCYDGTFQYKKCEKCNIVRKTNRGTGIWFNLILWNTNRKEGKP